MALQIQLARKRLIPTGLVNLFARDHSLSQTTKSLPIKDRSRLIHLLAHCLSSLITFHLHSFNQSISFVYPTIILLSLQNFSSSALFNLQAKRLSLLALLPSLQAPHSQSHTIEPKCIRKTLTANDLLRISKVHLFYPSTSDQLIVYFYLFLVF